MIHHKVKKKNLFIEKTFFISILFEYPSYIGVLRTFQTKSNKLFYIFFSRILFFFIQRFKREKKLWIQDERVSNSIVNKCVRFSGHLCFMIEHEVSRNEWALTLIRQMLILFA